MDTREHGPGDLAAVTRDGLPGPGVAGGHEHGAAPSSRCRSRAAAPAARAPAARWRRCALALGIADLLDRQTATLSGGELQRVGARGGAGHPAAPVAARRADVAARPGRRRRADRAAAAAERAVPDRPCCWPSTALERCLPAADRVLAIDRGAGSRATATPRGVRWMGGGARAARWRPRPRACSRSRGTRGRCPSSVKDARRRCGRTASPGGTPAGARPAQRDGARSRAQTAALRLARVWLEHEEGPRRPALRGVEPRAVAPARARRADGAQRRRQVHAAAASRRACWSPPAARSRPPGDVALLLQNPGDYLLHERVVDELPAAVGMAALAELGIDHVRAPTRATSPAASASGWRSRSCWPGAASAAASRRPWSRSTSRRAAWTAPRRRGWRACSRTLAARGAAVIVATHDAEFAAALADRVRAARRGPGGRRRPGARGAVAAACYFATEVARVLGGDERRAHAPSRARSCSPRADLRRWRPHDLAARQHADRLRGRRGGPRLVRAAQAAGEAGRARGRAGRARRGGTHRCSPRSRTCRPTTDIALLSGYALGPAPGFVVGAIAALASNVFLGQGPVDSVADARLGRARASSAPRSRVVSRPPARAAAAGRWPARSRASCSAPGWTSSRWSRSPTARPGATSRSRRSRFRSTSRTRSATSLICLAFGPAFVRMLVRFRRAARRCAGALGGAGGDADRALPAAGMGSGGYGQYQRRGALPGARPAPATAASARRRMLRPAS